MEFKQWLYEAKAIWRMSDIAKQDRMPNMGNRDTQNLGWRAVDGFMGGINDIQREKLWGSTGGPQHPSIRFPNLGDMKQSYQNAQQVYQGKDPTEPQAPAPVNWDEQIRLGTAVAHKQTLNTAGQNADAAMKKAFETLLQGLRQQNPNYTYQMQEYFRKRGYTAFLHPAKPQADATGNLNFQFVIPKPEYIGQ
jgi:hypothetical protein